MLSEVKYKKILLSDPSRASKPWDSIPKDLKL